MKKKKLSRLTFEKNIVTTQQWKTKICLNANYFQAHPPEYLMVHSLA